MAILLSFWRFPFKGMIENPWGDVKGAWYSGGYYGAFEFGLFNAKPGSRLQLLLRYCDKLQQMLNIVFRLVFRDRGLQSRFFSPYLLFIGRKK